MTITRKTFILSPIGFNPFAPRVDFSYVEEEPEPVFSDLIGKTISEIEVNHYENEIRFHTDAGVYRMYHKQDCCEDVYINDKSGDWDDLLGTPILHAEMSTNASEFEPGQHREYEYGSYPDHYTWSFYKLGTVKGWVDLRWFGQSNGCYSEEVDFELMEKRL